MKTTDEMILDLHEKAGFVLPEGLEWRDGHWKRNVDMHGYKGLGGWHTVPPRSAQNDCAMEFARQACRAGTWSYELSAAMCAGDSAAAIKALWEGVCDGV